MDESKRIKNLKNRLIKELPFFPNNKETLRELETKDLSGVLVQYLHWKTRIVPPRKRKVIIAPEVTADKRWKFQKDGIKALLDKVRSGEDIYPYHSRKAHKDGYTPFKKDDEGKVDSWIDKDQILNTKGFHHFHINMNVQKSGLSERTDDVLFAFVSRYEFHAVGIFNHDVFESEDSNGSMNTERTRMWELHQKHATLGMKPGTQYMSNPIMSSGHPLYLIRMSQYYSRIIKEHDVKLDDRDFVNDLYEQGRLPLPKKYDLQWSFDSLDIGIFDKKTKVFFEVHKGHI